MIPTSYQNDVSKLSSLFSPGRPLISLEINPPRGSDVSRIVERLQGKVGHIDFCNITDSALARMKFAALPFAAIIKTKLGIEPLVNLSCRDRNIVALQGDLLAAWAMGVRSVIALTGDAMSVGDSPELKGVFEINSVGLLSLIAKLNGGHDFAGNPLQGSPSFVTGVVANPNAKNLSVELRRLEKKFKAGASYVLTQPVFDGELALKFLKDAQQIGMPILLGLLPFRTARSALAVAEQVPGIKLSPAIADKMIGELDIDYTQFFLDHCLELAELTKTYVRGFHIVSGVTPLLALKLSKRLAKRLN